jgi:hypothetical protein
MSNDMGDALSATSLILTVPDNYEALLESVVSQSEVIGIQRLLTIARRKPEIRVEWQPAIAGRIISSSSIYPLLSVLLLFQGASHWVVDANGSAMSFEISSAQKQLMKHRFAKDMFADNDIVVCADNFGVGLPVDLYDPRSKNLRSREDFETLISDAIHAQLVGSTNRTEHYRYVSALGVIVAELFENTDMHARFDLNGAPLKPNCLRGMVFKRIHVNTDLGRGKINEAQSKRTECFEVSVFDSGLGYYSSYTRNRTGVAAAELMEEWKVLHNCLERRYYPDLTDKRAGHRAMGLFEVLRAVQALKGRIEIRTGRLYAYRTFLDGELQAQMQPKADLAHRAWPKPKLLDVDKKYVAIPSKYEELIGTSVRVIVPLS